MNKKLKLEDGEVIEIESIKAGNIKTGDLIVLTVADRMNSDQSRNIKRSIDHTLGDVAVKLIILEKGTTLDVYEVKS